MAAHEQQVEAAAAQHEDVSSRYQEAVEERGSLKAQLKALKAELVDTRAKLELRDYEAGLREAKDAAHEAQLEEASGKLKDKVAELESIRRTLQVSNSKAGHVQGVIEVLE